MKKFFISAIALCFFSMTQAQEALQRSKLTDNMSIGINGMGITPLNHHAFWKNMRGGVSLDINKQVTPILGFTIEGSAYFNSSEGTFNNPVHTNTIVDATNVSLLGRINLMNLFGSYLGEPRTFEMELVYGEGWLHTFGDLRTNPATSGVSNSLTSKLGMNLNFNLGKSKAWTFAIKPAIVWDMADHEKIGSIRYNANYASVELGAGFTYHFMNSNGTHHFAKTEPCDYSPIESLNKQVNDLRSQLEAKNNELNEANAHAEQLQNDLTQCMNRKPEVVEVKKNNAIPETVVTFNQGKTTVNNAQLPNVERVATYLKNHPEAKVSIKGYASPEGSAEINAKIAEARANAVKNILINKYKIQGDRIEAEGQGVGNMFSEADWNRVSICTIK